MIRDTQIDDPMCIEQLQSDYLHTLTTPMDGMWEEAVIVGATFREMQDDGRNVGHFCLDSAGQLLRFYVKDEFRDQAQKLFHWLVSGHQISSAIVSTIEPLYFSLCLDIQKGVVPRHYLFRDFKQVPISAAFAGYSFRKAEQQELADIARFYHDNAEGPGDWIEPFVQKRLTRGELFVCTEQERVIATGECILSRRQPPYADLGMIVAQAYRGRGLGTCMLLRLKVRCYEAGWRPICSCAVENVASKKAIEKAGFLSEQRMVQMTF